MRLAPFLSAAFFASVFGAHPACHNQDCNCPAGTFWPSVVIDLPCGSSPLPTLSLSGVCAGQGGEESGHLVFGANDPGTCHVELGYKNGSSFSADVIFAAEWLACGSDPHGCGQYVHPVGLPTDVGFRAVLLAGPSCEGGVPVMDADADE